jgi:uncharacterized protein YcnI
MTTLRSPSAGSRPPSSSQSCWPGEPAFAHVEISSDDAEAGQPSTMTVTVPNEMDNAGTNKVDVVFPRARCSPT